MRTYITVDPGLKNLAICLVQVWTEGPTSETQAQLLYNKIFDLSGKPNPNKERARIVFPQAAHEIAQIIGQKSIAIEQVLIEFQPPLATRANPALVRWNTWVEAYAVAFFAHCPILPPIPITYVHPSSVKRHFDITSGIHHVNKSLALARARCFLQGPLKTDHEADCVLMAIFQFTRPPL
jgi:hypothetical protein